MPLIRTSFVCLALAALVAACGESDNQTSQQDNSLNSERLGSVSIALSVPSAHFDVTHVRYQVTGMGTSQSNVVALEAEGLPAEASSVHQGAAFADWFVQLAVGDYTVTATPLRADGAPSDHCAVASDTVTVLASVTTEALLVSACNDQPSGGLDTVVVFNEGPHIVEVVYEPSKFICEDETVTIQVAVHDEDAVGVTWSVVGGPPGATLVGTGAIATFSALVDGRYELLIEVTDGVSTTSMTVPVYVSDCVDSGASNACDDADPCTVDISTTMGCSYAPVCEPDGCPAGLEYCADHAIYGPIVFSSVTAQTVSGTYPSIDLLLELTTSVQWPYRVETAFWSSVPAPTNIGVPSELSFATNADGVALQTWEMPLSAGDGQCSFTGTADVTLTIGCNPTADAATCDRYAAEPTTHTVSIAIATADFCPTTP